MAFPKITKQISFEAGHRLLDYDGLCNHLHGHSYLVEITIGSIDDEGKGSKDLNDLGMVVDFSEVKEKVKLWIDKNWDHAFLLNSKDTQTIYGLRSINSFVKDAQQRIYLFEDVNPTAENIAKELFEKVVKPCFDRKEGSRIIIPLGVKVWETANSYAEYSQ